MEEDITLEVEPEEAGRAGGDLAEKIKHLKEELKACEKEKQDYLTGWQRTKADYVNARKEEEARREDFVKFSSRAVLLDFLDLADSFDRAMMNRKVWEKVEKQWRQGIEYVYNQLMEILKTHGVLPVEAIGKLFDPRVHESVEEISIDNQEKDGIIISEAVRGYTLHGSVIRPSRVRVGRYKV